jgi:uncharacterized protein YbgA (DUF1722 family)/uncharacterized protein YbbK (DUF523 family)
MDQEPRPLVGISACLLGHQVRYDGGHKRDAFVGGPLAQIFDYLPVCPEVEIGLGIPRPPIRLIGGGPLPRAVGVDDPDLDVTGRLETLAAERVRGLAGGLDGYILKKGSPSCGMERVKVYPAQGRGPAMRQGQGVFARVLMQALPSLPVEEEGRLKDPVLREGFVNRVLVHRRWRVLREQGVSAAALIDFHTDHKYLVMAHSQAAYQRLGRMLADLSGGASGSLAECYLAELMQALRRRVDRKRHCNVLLHIMGYLKRHIDPGDKAELVASIDAYRRAEVPLIVPITLLRHYFRRHPDPYMARQVYLAPHPEGLGLRNTL